MTWSPSQPRKVTECIPQDTRGPKRLWDKPAGWVLRVRGADGGTRPMEFCCPVHGRFTVEVERGEDPDAVACPVEVMLSDDVDCGVCGGPNCHCTDISCGEPSPWSPSSGPALWHSAGEVMS